MSETCIVSNIKRMLFIDLDFNTRRQDNAQLLIKTLYQRPAMDVKAVAALLSVETNTATYLINDLVNYGVLEELTGKQRNRVFWFKQYLMIFSRGVGR